MRILRYLAYKGKNVILHAAAILHVAARLGDLLEGAHLILRPHEPILIRVLEGGRAIALAAEREWRAFRQIDGVVGIFRPGSGKVAQASEPTRCLEGIAVVRRMPDIHRFEVRTVRLRIADPLQDRQVAVIEQLSHAFERGTESHAIGELQALFGLVADRTTDLVVVIVIDRDHRVEAVIATAQLEHDKDLVVPLDTHPRKG